MEPAWHKSACSLCENNCGIEIQTGGDKIFYYGGGGQGDHLPAGYAMSTLAALGSRYLSKFSPGTRIAFAP